MIEQQVGHKIRVFGVILGAAGDKGFPILLEGDGVDGMECDPVVAFEEGDEMDGGLFETQADAGLGMLLAQFQQPFPERLGVVSMVWDRRWPVRVSIRCRSAFLSESRFGIGNDQVMGMRCIHGFGVVFFVLPQA
jgi:hypothetical protein